MRPNTILITCYFQKNYGSMLQAFATQQAVEALGYQTQTMNISGISPAIRKAKLRHYLPKVFSPQVLKGKSGAIRHIAKRRTNKAFAQSIAKRDEAFARFSGAKFNLTAPFASKEAMAEFITAQNAQVLVGSDQLWLPSNIDADYYTLNFVPSATNKIAYATSFGVSHLPERQLAKARAFLPRIQHISVREKSGAKLVQMATGTLPHVVCDPTLLLTSEEWRSFLPVKPLIKKPYIFCYFLGSDPKHRETARNMRQRTGLSIVCMPHIDEYVPADDGYADYVLYDVDPFDFLRLVDDASVVLTDSFHGTVFSTLFQKQFYTFRRFRTGSVLSTNTRLDSLLGSLGLESRLTENGQLPASGPIDFAPVGRRLAQLREDSHAFLKTALSWPQE